MPTLHQAIDLTSYAATAKGALASPTAFIAGLRPSYTTVAGLAVLGALAALGVGNARAVSPVSSVPDLGGAPAT